MNTRHVEQPVTEDDTFPLLPAQEHYIKIEDSLAESGHGTILNISVAWHLREALEPERLRRAIEDVCNANDATRLVLVRDGDSIRQRVLQAIRIDLPVFQPQGKTPAERIASGLAYAADLHRQPFDFQSMPSLRFGLIPVDSNECLLVAVCHHWVADAFTGQLMLDDILRAYDEGVVESGRPSFRSFVLEEFAFKTSPAGREQIRYWEELAEGYRTVDSMVTSRGRGQCLEDCYWTWNRVRLEKVARRCGVSPFFVLLAAYHVGISVASGRDDVCVYFAFIGRNRRYAKTYGLLSRSLPHRMVLGSLETVIQLVDRVRISASEAIRNQAMGRYSSVPIQFLLSFIDDVSGSATVRGRVTVETIPLAVERVPALVFGPRDDGKVISAGLAGHPEMFSGEFIARVRAGMDIFLGALEEGREMTVEEIAHTLRRAEENRETTR